MSRNNTEVLESFRCYITDRKNQQKFIRETRKRFVTEEPLIEGYWILYRGPRAEIQRLRLFYEGVVFCHRSLI